MSRLLSLHNKTQEVTKDDMPYNPVNVLLQVEDVRVLFSEHGLDGVSLHNINLYRNAFVHKSYCAMKNADFDSANVNLPPNCLPLQEMSYERLEYLGDSILGMVVARYLYERYPDQNEGFLSKMRTNIVNGKMLGSLASKIGFNKWVLISKQIEESQGRTNYKILEDTFEAFIGAIYMDFQHPQAQIPEHSLPPNLRSVEPMTGLGYHIAEIWIVSIMEKYLDFVELIKMKTNFKDMLSKWMHDRFQDTPRFFEISVNTSAKTQKSVFTYCVKDRTGAVLGTATGTSKKDAENNAARAALIYYGQPID